jgi:hypothetical protein
MSFFFDRREYTTKALRCSNPNNEYASRSLPVLTKYDPMRSKVWTVNSVGRLMKLLNRSVCIDVLPKFVRFSGVAVTVWTYSISLLVPCIYPSYPCYPCALPWNLWIATHEACLPSPVWIPAGQIGKGLYQHGWSRLDGIENNMLDCGIFSEEIESLLSEVECERNTMAREINPRGKGMDQKLHRHISYCLIF